MSTDTNGTLSRKHYVMEGGREASLLDVIEVEVTDHEPEPYQPENWVLSDRPWHLVRELDQQSARRLLRDYVVAGPELLRNMSDRVPVSDLNQTAIEQSLALIVPSNGKWEITRSIAGRRQTRVHFSLGSTPYDLGVTDPQWEHRLSRLPDGLYEDEDIGITGADRVVFTISLGSPFGGQCYKLVAGVLIFQMAS